MSFLEHRKRLQLFTLAGLFLLPLMACSNYSTYEDCLLAEVNANQTETAVGVIVHACRTKFPEPSPTTALPSGVPVPAQAASTGGTWEPPAKFDWTGEGVEFRKPTYDKSLSTIEKAGLPSGVPAPVKAASTGGTWEPPAKFDFNAPEDFDGVSYQKIGNTIIGSNGSSTQIIGNTRINSDGSSSQQIGNTRINSDGSSSQQIGNTRINSDGSSSQRIGNTIIKSDGTSCQIIGNQTICN